MRQNAQKTYFMFSRQQYLLHFKNMLLHLGYFSYKIPCIANFCIIFWFLYYTLLRKHCATIEVSSPRLLKI